MISDQAEALHTSTYKRGAATAFVNGIRKRGRIGFCVEELMGMTGLSELAARRQLTRLFPWVVRITPRQEFFLIVDPEHQQLGAPPPSWWLDAYFSWLGRPYYLALHSAAAEHGSTLQALQVTQVMTDKPRRDIVLGRVRIQFFVKSHAQLTPTQLAAHAFAPLAVSTQAATLVDLVQYAPRIGGIERCAETLLPLLPSIKRSDLLKALQHDPEVPTLQRLGFVLDALGCSRLADTVHAKLPSSLRTVVLNVGGESNSAPVDRRWSIFINATIGFPL
jgi:predicted transcriptional regulator of viral defense system